MGEGRDVKKDDDRRMAWEDEGEASSGVLFAPPTEGAAYLEVDWDQWYVSTKLAHSISSLVSSSRPSQRPVIRAFSASGEKGS